FLVLVQAGGLVSLFIDVHGLVFHVGVLAFEQSLGELLHGGEVARRGGEGFAVAIDEHGQLGGGLGGGAFAVEGNLLILVADRIAEIDVRGVGLVVVALVQGVVGLDVMLGFEDVLVVGRL